MDELKQCAVAFGKLFAYEYHLVAGSKKTLIDLTLAFHKNNFMHLIGLHKLKDLQLQRYSRDKLYDMVMNEELTYEDIRKSAFFPEIEERVKYFPLLEHILDSNELIIKYKRGFTVGTVISAEYIIVYRHEGITLHYFVDMDADSGKYVGKSFFGRTDDKFTARQQTFKVLKKQKNNLLNGSFQVLTDREIKPVLTERNYP